MGFAASLHSLTRLSLKIRPSSLGSSSSDSGNSLAETASFKPDSFEPDGSKLTHSNIPVIRANRTRRSSTSPRTSNKIRASTASARPPLTLPAKAAPASAPRQLKIVQREPRKQPECLFISGRMADVCAALERMALNE